MVNLLKVYALREALNKKAENSLITEEITFQNDNQTYQEHQNGNFINDVHGLQAKVSWAIGILFSEKIPSYFTQTEELSELTPFLFFLLHT